MTLAIFILGIKTASSQEKISTYKSGYFEKVYNVEVGKLDKKGGFTYYVEAAPQDDTKNIAIMLESSDQSKFISDLNEAKSVYEKWVNTAKANDVSELNKDIPVKFSRVGAAFTYGEWKFDYYVTIRPRFKIVKGKHLLIIESDELVASSNQFMKSEGFLLVFESSSEIEDFIKAIDLTKAQEFLKKKSSKEDLFN